MSNPLQTGLPGQSHAYVRSFVENPTTHRRDPINAGGAADGFVLPHGLKGQRIIHEISCDGVDEVATLTLKGLVGVDGMPEPLRGQTIADCNIRAAQFWYTPTWFTDDATAAANRPKCDWSTGFLRAYPAVQGIVRFGREPMTIPADDAALARYVRPVLDDHRPYIDRCIVGGGNEPQYPKYFAGTIQQYVDRVQRPLYKLAKAHDARWRVAGPAVVFDGSGSDASVMKQFTDAGLFDCIDVFDVHPYATSTGLASSLKLIPAFGVDVLSSEWNGQTYAAKDPADLLKCWDLLKARHLLFACLFSASRGPTDKPDLHNQLFERVGSTWTRVPKWYDNFKAMQ